MSDINIDSDGYISPLRTMAVESHEIYQELLAAGFPPKVVTQIMAQIISDSLLYRMETDGADDEDDDEDVFTFEIDDTEFDDTEDGPDDVESGDD